MDNSQFHSDLNAKMAQMLRNNPASISGQPLAYQQRAAQLANEPPFDPKTYSYTPPPPSAPRTHYPPSYYQMNPQMPIPVDYPYVVPTR